MTESRRSNPQLSQSVDDALFAVIDAAQSAPEPPTDSTQLRNQLHALCEIARRESTPVESLVIGLKAKLNHHASFKNLLAHEQAHRQAVIVSHLIAVYYSDR